MRRVPVGVEAKKKKKKKKRRRKVEQSRSALTPHTRSPPNRRRRQAIRRATAEATDRRRRTWQHACEPERTGWTDGVVQAARSGSLPSVAMAPTTHGGRTRNDVPPTPRPSTPRHDVAGESSRTDAGPHHARRAHRRRLRLVVDGLWPDRAARTGRLRADARRDVCRLARRPQRGNGVTAGRSRTCHRAGPHRQRTCSRRRRHAARHRDLARCGHLRVQRRTRGPHEA